MAISQWGERPERALPGSAEPGANIRVGFLIRTDRGLTFVDRPGGGPTTRVSVVSGPNGPSLSSSPGRIAPANPAFDQSRKPLAAELRYHGATLFVVNNHFASRIADDPLFGRFQPPTRRSEAKRPAPSPYGAAARG